MVVPPGRPTPPRVAHAEVTIVLVTYETPDHLTRCLASLERCGALGASRIIVVDNSPGDSCAEIARSHPAVELVENEHNLGYAKAVNQGIRRSTTPFVLVLNPDIELEPEAIPELRAAMDAHPEAGICAAKLLYPDGSLQLSCRTFYTLPVVLLRRTFLARWFADHRVVRQHLMSDWPHDTVQNVDWVLGACMMVRRAAIDEVGLMDERFFLYFEDVDWCARMHKRGWQVLYVPSAVMIHDHQRDSARGGPLSRSARLHLASVVKFYEKWSLLLYLLKRQRPALRTWTLVAADLVALNVAFLVAFGIRQVAAPWFEKPLFPLADYWQYLVVYNVAGLAALNAFGLYRADRPRDWLEVTLRVVPAVIAGALAVLVSTFLLYIRAYSRLIVVTNVPLAIALVAGLRSLVGRAQARLTAEGVATRRLLVVGEATLAARLSARLESAAGSYEVVAVYDQAALPWTGGAAIIDGFRSLCRTERVSELVVVSPDRRLVPVAELAQALESDGVHVRMVGEFSWAPPEAAAIEPLAGWATVSPFGGRRGPRFATSKRWLDVVVGLVVWGALAPLSFGLRLWGAVTGGSLERQPLEGTTAAAAPVERVRYRPRGLPQWVAHLFWARDRGWAILKGRESLVGVGVYPKAPDPLCAQCSVARPGWLTPMPDGPVDKRVEADRAYVLGWSTARDLRIAARAIKRARRRRGPGLPELP